MEVVLLLVAIVGVALIAVPRLQARRSGRRPSRRKRAVTRAAVVTPVAASWTPEPASDEDAWDDDLGWEGQDSAAPARDEWNRWRDSQAPSPESPELPSMDRWRERAASTGDWLEDDDGLGWEGEALTPPNRNGHTEPAGSPPSAGDIAAARHAAS